MSRNSAGPGRAGCYYGRIPAIAPLRLGGASGRGATALPDPNQPRTCHRLPLQTDWWSAYVVCSIKFYTLDDETLKVAIKK